jgi:hypothetical protein
MGDLRGAIDQGDARPAHQGLDIAAVTRKKADADVRPYVEQRPRQIDGLEQLGSSWPLPLGPVDCNWPGLVQFQQPSWPARPS